MAASIEDILANANDFYKILNVERDAGEQEIRRAYRRMALVAHPDRFAHIGAGSEAKQMAEDAFKLVSRAHEVLINANTRRLYDKLGHEKFVKMGSSGDSAENASGISVLGQLLLILMIIRELLGNQLSVLDVCEIMWLIIKIKWQQWRGTAEPTSGSVSNIFYNLLITNHQEMSTELHCWRTEKMFFRVHYLVIRKVFLFIILLVFALSPVVPAVTVLSEKLAPSSNHRNYQHVVGHGAEEDIKITWLRGVRSVSPTDVLLSVIATNRRVQRKQQQPHVAEGVDTAALLSTLEAIETGAFYEFYGQGYTGASEGGVWLQLSPPRRKDLVDMIMAPALAGPAKRGDASADMAGLGGTIPHGGIVRARVLLRRATGAALLASSIDARLLLEHRAVGPNNARMLRRTSPLPLDHSEGLTSSEEAIDWIELEAGDPQFVQKVLATHDDMGKAMADAEGDLLEPDAGSASKDAFASLGRVHYARLAVRSQQGSPRARRLKSFNKPLPSRLYFNCQTSLGLRFLAYHPVSFEPRHYNGKGDYSNISKYGQFHNIKTSVIALPSLGITHGPYEITLGAEVVENARHKSICGSWRPRAHPGRSMTFFTDVPLEVQNDDGGVPSAELLNYIALAHNIPGRAMYLARAKCGYDESSGNNTALPAERADVLHLLNSDEKDWELDSFLFRIITEKEIAEASLRRHLAAGSKSNETATLSEGSRFRTSRFCEGWIG